MARPKGKNKKKKQTCIKRDLTGTGGGPAQSEQLDAVEERILDTIGEVPISGDPYTNESTLQFDFNENQPSITKTDTPATAVTSDYM